MDGQLGAVHPAQPGTLDDVDPGFAFCFTACCFTAEFFPAECFTPDRVTCFTADRLVDGAFIAACSREFTEASHISRSDHSHARFTQVGR